MHGVKKVGRNGVQPVVAPELEAPAKVPLPVTPTMAPKDAKELVPAPTKAGPSSLIGLRAKTITPPDLSPVSADNVGLLFEAHTDFRDSRARFENLANFFEATHPNVEQLQIPVVTKSGQSETVHTLTLHATKQPETVVYLTSGVHGAEGPYGGVSQEAFLRNHLPDLDRDRTTVVLVHGVNPMSWINNARSDDFNIDGNRSSNIDPEAAANPDFVIVQDTMTASQPPAATALGNLFETALGLGGAVLQHSKDDVIKALAEGQDIDPKAPLYRGDQEPAHYAALRDQVFEPTSRGAKGVVHMDFHTGLGEAGVVHWMDLGNEPDIAEEFLGAFNLREAVHQPPADQPYETRPVDFLSQSIFTAPKNAKVLAMTVEVGGPAGDSLIGLLKTAAVLRERNQLQFFPQETSPAKAAAIMRRFTEQFNPPDQQWRESSLKGTNVGFHRLIRVCNTGAIGRSFRPAQPAD